MKQYYPLAFDPFMSFATTALGGLRKLEKILGVLQNTAAATGHDAERARTVHQLYQAAIAATTAAVLAKDQTAKDVADYIGRAREVLKRRLGARYSRAWSEAGFLSPTLQLSPKLNVQQSVLKSLEAYFLAHPDAEVKDWDVTAARASELHDLTANQVHELLAARADQRQMKADRDAAMKQLRRRMRFLYRELRQLLPANDPRWVEFGFNIPAAASTPAAPENLTITQPAEDESELTWKRSSTATHYRVYRQVEGTDDDYVYLESVTETSLRLSSSPPATRERFRVTAVNTAGESVPSASVERSVPEQATTDLRH